MYFICWYWGNSATFDEDIRPVNAFTSQRCLLETEILCFIYLFFAFYGHTYSIWKFPGQGSNLRLHIDLSHCSYSYHLQPQPQQCQIRAMSAAYTAQVNAGFFNPLSEVRDRTCILMNTSRVRYWWAIMGTLRLVCKRILAAAETRQCVLSSVDGGVDRPAPDPGLWVMISFTQRLSGFLPCEACNSCV